jgi:S-adenosylmethionine-diacylgycerolhomoserine-N-methlytransferase
MSAAADGNITAENTHAGLMDRMYRHQRHFYDLTRKYYLLGRDETIAKLDVPFGGTLLEVGCGTGRNLLLAQRHFSHCRLYGLDISSEMLATAQGNFRESTAKPHLIVADATTFTSTNFGIEAGFDRIMISYALSMIPDWESAIDAAIAALAPNGSLHIVDFGQQENLPALFKSFLQSWLARFHVTPRKTLRQVLEERVKTRNASLEFQALGRGYAWRAVVRLSKQ